MRRTTIAVACCLLALAVGTASAAPINITGISGVWVNPVGGQNLNGVGTSSVSWGDGNVPDSGYRFTAQGDIIGAAMGTPLYLGLFTHYNEPIPAGSSITAIDLSFGFFTNGLPASVATIFNFTHDETTNSRPCAAGSVSVCDDYVTIVQPIVNQLVTVGTDSYYFNLLGFSLNNGSTFSTSFSSPEDGTNTAKLYGTLRSVPTTVPEPASSLMLLGMGLAALAAGRRARRS